MNDATRPSWVRPALVAAMLGVLLFIGFVVLQPFLTAVAWAAILVSVAWPLHERLPDRLKGRRVIASLAMAALGRIGLVAGPVILAILLARWREWGRESTARRADRAPQETERCRR